MNYFPPGAVKIYSFAASCGASLGRGKRVSHNVIHYCPPSGWMDCPPRHTSDRLFDFPVRGSVCQAVMIEFFKIRHQITSSVKSGNIQEVG